jgi:protein-L-isoaspartate(D-aspartate) O-methyltransferase
MHTALLIGIAICCCIALGLVIWLNQRDRESPPGIAETASPEPLHTSVDRGDSRDASAANGESANMVDEPSADLRPDGPREEPPEEPHYLRTRHRMVETQMQARGIRDPRVLDAMRTVPRHRFVSPDQIDQAYRDHPLGIGHGQTISQPYIVALMTELARPSEEAIALDVGTGSGYQAAVLSLVCKEVYSIEIVEALADSARQRLASLGYDNVTVRCGDGYRGWAQRAPFDLIIVAAAPDHIPQPLVDQLREGGRLVIPVGDYFQKLMVVEKGPGGKCREWAVSGVAFVPMTGEAQK